MNIEISTLISSAIGLFGTGLTIGYWLGSRNPQITRQNIHCPSCEDKKEDNWSGIDIVL